MAKDEYLQKFQTTYTQGRGRFPSRPEEGLIENDVKALALDAFGNLWVGTSSGVSRFDGEGWTNDDTIPNISAMYSDKSGKIWVSGGGKILLWSGDTWERVVESAELDGNICSITEDAKGNIWVATETQFGYFDGKNWRSSHVADALIRDIAIDGCGRVWLATDRGLRCCSRICKNSGCGEASVFASQDIFEASEDGLLSNDVRCVAVDASGHLWVGTSAGINIFDGKSQPGSIQTKSEMGIRAVKGWYSITGKNGLPYEDVHIIAIASGERKPAGNLGVASLSLPVAPSSRARAVGAVALSPPVVPLSYLWVGTSIGVASLQGGRWEYYASKRWLPDDRVTAIAVQSDGVVWVGTPQGLSKIEKRPYTLERKAEFFEEGIQQRHNRYGYVTSSALEHPGDLSSSVYEASDNDGLWTALYIAAESFRYAVTKEEEAKKLAQKSLRALMRLEEITPIDGFPARAIIQKGEKVHQSHGEWHDTPLSSARNSDLAVKTKAMKTKDEEWEWKGDTSSDEIDGHLFAYSVYCDVVADEEEKQEIAKVVGRIMTHIVDNDFLLVDVDGERTRWGVWSPKLLNATWIDQQGLNSLEILAHLKTAYHITGDEKFQNAYLHLINEHHYALNTIEQKILPPGEVNHSDDELAFISYYPLLKYEVDPNLRAIYLLSLERSWQIERPERCALWNFIYGALTGNDCDVENSRDMLRSIPMDLIRWTVKNSHRANIKIDPESGRTGALQSVKALPADERAIMRWNGNPYRMDAGNDGRSEDDGTFFLLPYWMGRYYGFLE